MKFFIFSFLLLFSLISAYGEMDCTELDRMCKQAACEQAGGEYSGAACAYGAGFQMGYYQNATGECAILKSQCEETDGMMLPQRDASCCGPVFLLLAALGFAAGSPRFK